MCVLRVLFRVDASLLIGCGHVYRCLTLAAKLTEYGCQTLFVCTAHAGNLIDFIAAKGYQVHVLPMVNYTQTPDFKLGRSWQEDAQLTAQIISTLKIDWLIVDHYQLDGRWHKTLKSAAYRLMVIDDLANRFYDSDRLLDQTYGRIVQDYSPLISGHTKLLLGTDFSLLRDEFIAARVQALSRRIKHVRIQSILLSLGGTDNDNITERVIRLLAATSLADTTILHVVAGPNNPHLASLQLATQKSRFQCRLYTSVTDMAELMVSSDLAIGAAGCSAWERCVLYLPGLNITLADNQVSIAARLAENGAAISLGEPNTLTAACLSNAIGVCEANYLAMAQKAGELVDGIGASRVALSLFSVCDAKGLELYLKRVSWQDCARLFDWQQAAATRRYALNPSVPSWEEHCEWLRKMVMDPRSFLFMIRRQNNDVGMVRIDPMTESGWYQISIVTGSGYYRQGVAKAALELIRRIFRTITISATVLPENLASQSLFNSMGYVQVDNTQWLQYPSEATNE